MRYVALFLVVVLFTVGLVDVLEPVYGFFGKVPTASVGVVTIFGDIQEEVLEPGFHIKGWFDKINNISTKTQKYSTQTSAFSSDIQQVDLSVTLNYNVDKINAPRLFETVGKNYESMLIEPRLVENIKIVISRYNAEALLENRGSLAGEITALMQDDLIQFGINASGVAIEDIDFTDAFTAAVETKQVATQEKLTAQTEQEKLTMQAKAEAERQHIIAQAEAEKAKVAADAEAYAIQTKAAAEAEANRMIAESLTGELIDYTQVQGWNGQLPSIYSGDGEMIPILNVESEDVG